MRPETEPLWEMLITYTYIDFVGSFRTFNNEITA